MLQQHWRAPAHIHSDSKSELTLNGSQAGRPPVDKVLERGREVALQLWGSILGDEEQHAHGVEVGVGRRAGRHLRARPSEARCGGEGARGESALRHGGWRRWEEGWKPAAAWHAPPLPAIAVLGHCSQGWGQGIPHLDGRDAQGPNVCELRVAFV